MHMTADYSKTSDSGNILPTSSDRLPAPGRAPVSRIRRWIHTLLTTTLLGGGTYLMWDNYKSAHDAFNEATKDTEEKHNEKKEALKRVAEETLQERLAQITLKKFTMEELPT